MKILDDFTAQVNIDAVWINEYARQRDEYTPEHIAAMREIHWMQLAYERLEVPSPKDDLETMAQSSEFFTEVGSERNIALAQMVNHPDYREDMLKVYVEKVRPFIDKMNESIS